jgi:hypothetical protein
MKLEFQAGIGLKKNLLLIIIFMVISLVILSGCSEENNILTDEELRFVGTWYGGGIINDVVAFFTDGYCSYYLDLNCLWKVEDGKLIITLEDKEEIYDYEFDDNDMVLRIFVEGTMYSKAFAKQ